MEQSIDGSHQWVRAFERGLKAGRSLFFTHREKQKDRHSPVKLLGTI
jgi:hypothetical protein